MGVADDVASKSDGVEYGWLIERGPVVNPSYLCTLTVYTGFVWLSDVNKAIRFAREHVGQTFIQNVDMGTVKSGVNELVYGPGVRVVQHAWMSESDTEEE